jgi:hypothetical protein
MASARIVIKPTEPLTQTLEVRTGITVTELIGHLQDLIARDPAAANCFIVHNEFGLMMPSKRVGVNIATKKVFIG